MLAIVDDDTCECLALVADTSLSGLRVARELDGVIRLRGRPGTIVSDNGTEFTDRLFGSRARWPSGEHEFDRLCATLEIEHRLTKPKTPQTNGMVERFNGRLEQVLRTHRFNSRNDLESTLHRYVWLYNEHLPQKALEHVAPLDALKRWQKLQPDLFVKQVRNHPAPDT